MNKVAILSAACLFAFTSSAAWAQRPTAPETAVVSGKYIPSDLSAFWMPDEADVRKADAGIGDTLNFSNDCGPGKIGDFARYYVGLTESGSGRRLIVGAYFRVKQYPGTAAGIHITSKPVDGSDGGCNSAQVWFDAGTLKLVSFAWGGLR